MPSDWRCGGEGPKCVPVIAACRARLHKCRCGHAQQWLLNCRAVAGRDPIAYALGFLDCNEISARCMLSIFQFFATKTDASVLRMLNGSPAERLLAPIVDYITAKCAAHPLCGCTAGLVACPRSAHSWVGLLNARSAPVMGHMSCNNLSWTYLLYSRAHALLPGWAIPLQQHTVLGQGLTRFRCKPC